MATKKKTKAADSDEKPVKKKKAAKKKKAEDTGETKKKAVKKPRKKAAKRSRKKEAVPDRFKIYWGVFNHALKRVALYEFNQKKAADKRASELSDGGKPPHFVQKIKEVIDPSTIVPSGDEEE
jgi:hypothetical protein